MDGGGLGALILPTPVISAYIENHGGECASERERKRGSASEQDTERKEERERESERKRKKEIDRERTFNSRYVDAEVDIFCV